MSSAPGTDPNNAVYRITQQVCGFVLGRWNELYIEGMEHIPSTGGFLLASNHVSYYDPPLVGHAIERPVYYFARKTLTKWAIGAWLMPRINCILVDRDGPADVGALKRALAVVKAGNGLVVFPEGTRAPDGKPQPAKAGVGFLAAKLQVPVVPARVFGTFEAWPRHRAMPRPGGRLGVSYGRALVPGQYDPGPKHPERHEEISRRILAAIYERPCPWRDVRLGPIA